MKADHASNFPSTSKAPHRWSCGAIPLQQRLSCRDSARLLPECTLRKDSGHRVLGLTIRQAPGLMNLISIARYENDLFLCRGDNAPAHPKPQGDRVSPAVPYYVYGIICWTMSDIVFICLHSSGGAEFVLISSRNSKPPDIIELSLVYVVRGCPQARAPDRDPRVDSLESSVTCVVDIGLYKHRMSNERLPPPAVGCFWVEGGVTVNPVEIRNSLAGIAVQFSASGTGWQLFRN